MRDASHAAPACPTRIEICPGLALAIAIRSNTEDMAKVPVATSTSGSLAMRATGANAFSPSNGTLGCSATAAAARGGEQQRAIHPAPPWRRSPPGLRVVHGDRLARDVAQFARDARGRRVGARPARCGHDELSGFAAADAAARQTQASAEEVISTCAAIVRCAGARPSTPAR